jgi:hypothetical protein
MEHPKCLELFMKVPINFQWHRQFIDALEGHQFHKNLNNVHKSTHFSCTSPKKLTTITTLYYTETEEAAMQFLAL